MDQRYPVLSIIHIHVCTMYVCSIHIILTVHSTVTVAEDASTCRILEGCSRISSDRNILGLVEGLRSDQVYRPTAILVLTGV